MWQPTGGSVQSGESSLEGAIREVKEEIGLDIKAEKMTLFKSKAVGEGSGWIADYWHLYDDIKIKDIICQEEVAEVKWASVDEIRGLIKANMFFNGEVHLSEVDLLQGL